MVEGQKAMLKKEKRVFILGAPGFPRGSAGANYDQYLALALLRAGWRVIILGKGVNRPEDKTGNTYIYKDIEYRNEKPTKIEKYGMTRKFYAEMYKEYKMTRDDYYILHDIGWRAQSWLAQKIGTEHMSYIHYEDLLPIQYRHHLVNPRYWGMIFKWKFKLKVVPKAFPISEKLQSVEMEHGCKHTLILPIMSDPDEFGEAKRILKPELLKFIYSGAKANTHEDDLSLLFQALQMLTDDEKKKIEIHITGMSKDKLEEKVGNPELLKGLTVEVHGWMKYSELIELYREMDFLALPRFKNGVTEANFPSKIPESLSFGIIPVCSKVGDYTRTYLEDGYNSFLFETGNVNACVQSLRRALNITEEDYLKMRKNARRTAVEKFGYKNWSEEISLFLKK